MNHWISLSMKRTFAGHSIVRGDSRRKVFEMRLAGFLAIFGLAMALTPNALAQSGKPSEAEKTQASSFSHDLSGVWMQYPEGDLPGTPGMNTVNQRFRPPLTPWGQARQDAARPLVGPKAIPGVENSPTFRCDPDGSPKLLNHPNAFEIVQIPGRVFMFFEEQHIWRTIWTDGRPLPKDPDPSYLGYSVGKREGDTFVVETIGFNDKLWDDSFGNPRSDAPDRALPAIESRHFGNANHHRRPQGIHEAVGQPPKLHKLEPGWEIAEWFCVLEEDNAYDEAVRKPALRPQPNRRAEAEGKRWRLRR